MYMPPTQATPVPFADEHQPALPDDGSRGTAPLHRRCRDRTPPDQTQSLYTGLARKRCGCTLGPVASSGRYLYLPAADRVNNLKPCAIRFLGSGDSKVPHATSFCAAQALATVSVAASTFGALGFAPGVPTPSDKLRSAGPINTPPRPGTLRISSTFLTPSR